jgi:hypothetical protein
VRWRGRAGSKLQIAVPICLLAAAGAADRIFHRHPSREPAAASPAPRLPPRHAADGALAVTLARSPVEVVGKEILDSCWGPEGVDDCAPRALAAAHARHLPMLRAQRDAFERLWLSDLAGGNHTAAYGLALLGSRRALPVLRARLLAERYFYGWETSSLDDPKILFADEQFPRHLALIHAIEWIDGRPLRSVVKLSDDERHQLARDAAVVCDGQAATWLLHKLDGAPLPRAAVNRARRLQCDE